MESLSFKGFAEAVEFIKNPQIEKLPVLDPIMMIQDPIPDFRFIQNLRARHQWDPDVLRRAVKMRIKVNNGEKLSFEEAGELLLQLGCRNFPHSDLDLSRYHFQNLVLFNLYVGGDFNCEDVVVEGFHVLVADIDGDYVAPRMKIYGYNAERLNIRGNNNQEDLFVGGKNETGGHVHGDNNQRKMKIIGDNQQIYLEIGGDNNQQNSYVQGKNWQEEMKVAGDNNQNSMQIEGRNDQNSMRVGRRNEQREMKVGEHNMQIGMHVHGMNFQQGMVVSKENHQCYMQVGDSNHQRQMSVGRLNAQNNVVIQGDNDQREMRVRSNEQLGVAIHGNNNQQGMYVENINRQMLGVDGEHHDDDMHRGKGNERLIIAQQQIASKPKVIRENVPSGSRYENCFQHTPELCDLRGCCERRC